ncbi:MAG: hypothetical protein QOE06_2849 [Thermoleophilaceae bacterium]|nr:hypothetical protein [Thermoleophilaceae bacterium]
MRDYDALDPVFHPYLGFSSPHNFRSPSVCTDSLGFRQSEFESKVVSTESHGAGDGFGVALGGSFAFGVGATHDRHSFASRLGAESGRPYLNRAVRAGNSMQELLAALPVLDRADEVVICTGVNNLALTLWSSRTYDGLGPLFYDEPIAALAGRRLDELAGALGGSAGLRSTFRGGLAAARGRDRPSGPPRPRLDPEAIVSAAAGRHLRDVALVAAAARVATRVIFVVQSFGDPRIRELHHDERALIQPLDGSSGDWWTSTLEFVGEHWAAYTETLRSGCDEIDVRFGALDATEFEGWAYVDRVHMTDHGQQQAARRIVEMMSNGAA